MVCKIWAPKSCPKQVGRFVIRGFRCFERVRPAIFWLLLAIFKVFRMFSLSFAGTLKVICKKMCTFVSSLLATSLILSRTERCGESWYIDPSPDQDYGSMRTKLPQNSDQKNNNEKYNLREFAFGQCTVIMTQARWEVISQTRTTPNQAAPIWIPSLSVAIFFKQHFFHGDIAWDVLKKSMLFSQPLRCFRNAIARTLS